MAIDRGPWNALVDDDGSNTVGSLWNKAAIKTVILDPTDVAIATVGAWANVPFSAANFWGGVAAGHVTINQYAQIGKIGFWIVQVNAAPAPSPATLYLQLAVPVSPMRPGGVLMPLALASDGTGVTPSQLFVWNTGTVGINKIAGGNWTGSVSLNYTAILALE